MKLVIVESPYAGDIERNVVYARACMRDCLERGEAPYASHLLYTQPGVLRDEYELERKLGIEAGFAWWAVAELHVFYQDLGMSRGMMAALEKCRMEGRAYEFRTFRSAVAQSARQMKTPPIDVNELLKWLRGSLHDVEKHRDRAAAERSYGEAQLAEGLSQAYAYTILHVERVLKGQP